MSYITVYVHYVWSTKNGYPFLQDDIRYQVFDHILDNAKEKDIYIDELNGYDDHIHCLVSMGPDKSLEKIANLIKGESSHWVNQNKLTKKKFAWQSDYWVASVGKSEINRVRKYIRNQEKHHQKKSFEEENEALLKEFSFIT